jgi:FkbH-like protein
MKKCIVLDLDNTLWGGVVGEDGIDGLALSLTSPGAYFIAFQQALLDLYNRGVILAIDSKNNYEDAMAVIRSHPNMILKEHHFAAMRINWKEKTDNIRELAEELNVGTDSMVFLDDSQTNREAMRAFVPEVETPELPEDPQMYTKFLNSLPYFESNVTTDEDKMRGNLYVTERLRKESEKEFSDHGEFLKSLRTELQMYEDVPTALPRLSQLTEKTNQFNTKKTPMTVKEIQDYIFSPEHVIFYASASDRFGDHGIIAFAVVQKEKEQWTICSLLMSCRVLGRGIEEAFLGSIAARAKAGGAQTLYIDFVQTEKNQPAKDFLDKYTDFGTLFVHNFALPDWVDIRKAEKEHNDKNII